MGDELETTLTMVDGRDALAVVIIRRGEQPASISIEAHAHGIAQCDAARVLWHVARKWSQRPEIVVLCGSTRFGQAFRQANLLETIRGNIVLSIGCDTRTDNELWPDPTERDQLKIELDELHLRKIDLADRVLVLNVGGYLGESTAREIAYAQGLNKVIEYLEPPGVIE